MSGWQRHDPAEGAAWLIRPATQSVFAMIEGGGFAARAVGGCVRNALMGVPVTDIDIATTALPQDVIKLAAAAGLATEPTGIAHGTVMVIVAHEGYEVTTLRRDVSTDGRRATVAFTDDWAEDAARRDFSMNALYCDSRGQVFDPLGGLSDLQARRVRFIGKAEDRIREDYLRILRFFRFHAMYGAGALDREGASACVRLRAGLAQLSAERVGAETMKLLVAPRAIEAVSEMFGLGLLGDVLGGVPRLTRFARLAALDTAPDAALRLAALAVETDEDAARLHTRLRLSRDQHDVLRRAAEWQTQPPPLASAHDIRCALYRWGRAMTLRLALLRHANPWLALREPVPVFPVKGADLVARGLRPGPEIGRRLAEMENRWIASDFQASTDDLLSALTQDPVQ